MMKTALAMKTQTEDPKDMKWRSIMGSYPERLGREKILSLLSYSKNQTVLLKFWKTVIFLYATLVWHSKCWFPYTNCEKHTMIFRLSTCLQWLISRPLDVNKDEKYSMQAGQHKKSTRQMCELCVLFKEVKLRTWCLEGWQDRRHQQRYSVHHVPIFKTRHA